MPTSVADARDALEVASWRAAIGEQPAEGLIELAVGALVAGMEGPALSELAGSSPRDSRVLWDPWGAVVAEQRFEPTDEQTALWKLVRQTAGQVTEGSLDPIVGAQWLWRSAACRLEPEGDLRVFIGLASEMEDHPDRRGVLAREVVEACRALLARQRPRRWLRMQASKDTVLSLSATDRLVPLSSDDLGLADGLQSRVNDWRQQWVGTLASGGFPTMEAAELFVATGVGIAEELQRALGPSWNVEYCPEPTRPPGLWLRPAAP